MKFSDVSQVHSVKRDSKFYFSRILYGNSCSPREETNLLLPVFNDVDE